MLIILASLIATAAFVVLLRLVWLSQRPSRATTIVTVATLMLIAALAMLAATGRLHWLAAVGAAVLPFLRRGFSLVRYLPFLGRLYRQFNPNANPGQGPGGEQRSSAPDVMTPQQARAVLDLGPDASKQDVVDAHRRLMTKIHPDKGGSTFLAQQLNEAKRVLIKRVS